MPFNLRVISVWTAVWAIGIASPWSAFALEPGQILFARSGAELTGANGRKQALWWGENLVFERVDGARLVVRAGVEPGTVAAGTAMTADEAIKAFGDALAANPKDVAALVGRANVHVYAGRPEQAVSDASAALAIDSKAVRAYLIRSTAHSELRQFREALADADKAIELDPRQAAAHNSRAWLLATAPIEGFRNASEAKASAKQACEMTAWKDRRYLDTLAAAHAEAGEFAEAVKWQTQAAELAPATARANYIERLKVYQSGRPYREGSAVPTPN